MKLNPLKCAFRVRLGKFLGFMVNQRRIEANPEKCALGDELSQEAQRSHEPCGQSGHIKSFCVMCNRSLRTLFEVLKRSKKFEWTDKCEQAFLALKEHIGHPPLLLKPIEGKSSTYTSLFLRTQSVSPWYPEFEKLALALMVASIKLRPYFHAHLIEVLTNYPLHQALLKLEASGRLLKWAIKLGQFEVNFYPQTEIKGQALADFISKFTYSNVVEVIGMANNTEATKE